MKPIEDHMESALDAALAMTFPASDPVAILVAEPGCGQPDRDQIAAEGRGHEEAADGAHA
jgi:hypothetical protein